MPEPTPHPAVLSVDELRKQCEARRLRRSGPGGQHRNKVETAVVLKHLPTGIEAEANERRSQSQNANQAVHRLRVRLAVEVRTELADQPSQLWQERAAGRAMRVSTDHPDYPALLAEALNYLSAADWNDKATAEQLGVTRTALLRLLKGEPSAMHLLNAARREQGYGSLQ